MLGDDTGGVCRWQLVVHGCKATVALAITGGNGSAVEIWCFRDQATVQWNPMLPHIFLQGPHIIVSSGHMS